MAEFKVYGADRHTGEDIAQVITAASAEQAEAIAHERGMVVSHVERVPEPEARFDPGELRHEPSRPIEPARAFRGPEHSEREPTPLPSDMASAPRGAERPADEPDEPAQPPRQPDEPEPPQEPEPEPEPEPELEPEPAPSYELESEPEPTEPAEPAEPAEPTESTDAAAPREPTPPGLPPAPIDAAVAGNRWGHGWLAYLRISFGLLWLFELLLGRGWKIGLTEGPHPQWLGAEAGATLTAYAQRAPDRGVPAWLEWFVEATLLPHAGTWSVVLVVAQFAIAVSLILGLFVRPVALVALAYSLVAIGLGDVWRQPLFALAHLVMLVTAGGRILSLDALILRRLQPGRGALAGAVGRVINLALLPRATLLPLAGLAALAALYHFIALVEVDAQRVYLELTVLLGLTAMSLFALRGAMVTGATGLTLSDVVRIFVGFKLVQLMLAGPAAPFESLPGGLDAGELSRVLGEIQAHHWPPLADVIEQTILLVVAAWAIGFAIVQAVVGVFLLLGRRPRLASTVGVIYLALVTVLGFVVMPPVLLIYAIFVLGAGSRWLLLVDVPRGAGVEVGEPIPPAAWPRWAAVICGVVAIALLVFAGIEGVETSGYLTTLPGFAAVGLAIPLIALALIAWPRRN